jgi:AcrR family transcriptional regulator
LPRQDTRGAILRAAAAVFKRKGYRATTVSDILAEAHVARGTYYRYFSSKRHAFQELVGDLFKGIHEASLGLVTGEGPMDARLKDTFAQCYRMFIDNRGVLLTYLRDGITVDPGMYALWDDFDRRMTALFSEVLTHCAETGEFRRVDTDLVSRAMMLLFLQVPYRHMMGSRADIDVELVAGEVVSLALDGLVPRAVGGLPEGQ